MEKQLEKYNHKYKKDDSQLDTIVDDFIEMCKYFDSFEADDFRKENNVSVTDNLHRQDSPQSSRDIPLNQILYGPPGTGKTYHSINKALEILQSYGQLIPESRKEQKELFDKFRQNGQIGFVTFHQSYGYEEFVEGIKPSLSGEIESSNVRYEIKNGIFKTMCERALENYTNSQKELSALQKDYELDELLEAYAEYVERELDEEREPDFITSGWKTKMKIVGVHRLQNGEFKSIKIGAKVGADSTQSLAKEVIKRDYERFKSGEIKDWNDVKPSYESKSHRHGNAGYYITLYKAIADFENSKFWQPTQAPTQKEKKKPYILIIDEINRGNISKILGELITLLEPSKRIGSEEELRVRLPYSGDEFDRENGGFGVPQNLYIIGTMNTADRSIALLDTALRRRFEFIEMLPNPKELEKISCDDGEIDLKELLKAMNNRIEFLLDRERTIGHSFFFEKAVERGIEQYELTLTDLKAVFKNKILPLLQEYFYDDYAKINAVLNDNGMIKSQTQQDLGIKLDDEFVDSQKKVWSITDSSSWAQWQFQKIYDTNAKPAESKESPESSNEPSE
ncbi:AAA family ATPase [uncultured Helicobacter sp.]|uniref:McrB family protein n=1 Tax=uncultured Helicobacter sp. TaxID=175537 RepID=UPI002622D23B|nr:AAA family ATPase [uncultured Helicobacter sp.]